MFSKKIKVVDTPFSFPGLKKIVRLSKNAQFSTGSCPLQTKNRALNTYNHKIQTAVLEGSFIQKYCL